MTGDRAAYMLQRYHERRAYAIVQLGGKCVICGSEEELQLDHIKREEKSFPIGQMWSVSWERFEAELAKCQLLCWQCHKAKTVWEMGRKDARLNHGTLASYRYCKCDLCKKAYADYWKSYKPRKKRAEPKKAIAPGIKKGPAI